MNYNTNTSEKNGNIWKKKFRIRDPPKKSPTHGRTKKHINLNYITRLTFNQINNNEVHTNER